MHMSDALVSFAVGTTMATTSTGFIGYSIRKINKTELSDHKIPMMGVMGAFVFAAQMINFTIPITGSSGHISGGILLAALLGPYPAFITLASVLIIQALFFADGGLLALGCNIFNMGVFTCLVAYPLIYKPILRKTMTPLRIMVASVLAAIVGLQLGAFSVVLQTSLSGITDLPFTTFLALMQPIQLAIGVVEGLATGAVLCFIYRVRKEVLVTALESNAASRISMKKIIICFVIVAVFLGGFVSMYASSLPDGLEWSIQGALGTDEIDNTSTAHAAVKSIQDKTSIFPDYNFTENSQESTLGTSISGIVGGVLTLIMTVSLGAIIFYSKKLKRKKESISNKQ